MTPEFANLVNPIFHRVLDLMDRLERGERPDLEHERNLIRNELEDAELTAASPESPVRLEEFQLAKRALIYWIDEVLTVANPDWKEITLEREYYGTRDRAANFYVEGELKARRSSPDVVETWYLAMVLGFVGDIGEAYDRHHLNRPLPGGTTNKDEARKFWAAELARQIRQPATSELSGEPLQGDVSPLYGTAFLQTAAAFLTVAVLAFAVLLVLWLRQQ